MFDPGDSRSSPPLPVFGIVARVALWGGSCQGPGEAAAFFWRIDDWGINLQKSGTD